MVHNQHYLYRMTVLVAITSLASVVSHETLYQTILPAVVSCAKDKVKRNACRTQPAGSLFWLTAYGSKLSGKQHKPQRRIAKLLAHVVHSHCQCLRTGQ